MILRSKTKDRVSVPVIIGHVKAKLPNGKQTRRPKMRSFYFENFQAEVTEEIAKFYEEEVVA